MGRAARRKMEMHFRIEHQVAKIEEIYDKIAGHHRPPA
jgi:hypothetical protein